ncbi:hypothetical protein L207DRAFT_294964 [Hyaloscypha variabilis F]|jgi:hypothetical protein|uniref:Uncharacterized protein n=1 Tax=Hyaloscypha variabilis (strain UAMH 11265 / GT02V1 / F) TaxID=1149755 RepID=A0A2J6RXW4_HYAVF|nr:hypothetical protein L207DRAFT_294964 [Hyaloscypha variabilis F]
MGMSKNLAPPTSVLRNAHKALRARYLKMACMLVLVSLLFALRASPTSICFGLIRGMAAIVVPLFTRARFSGDTRFSPRPQSQCQHDCNCKLVTAAHTLLHHATISPSLGCPYPASVSKRGGGSSGYYGLLIMNSG